jgi:hypothetical protein
MTRNGRGLERGRKTARKKHKYSEGERSGQNKICCKK